MIWRMKSSPALACAALLISSAAIGQETRESPMRRKFRDWLESARGPTLKESTVTALTSNVVASLDKGDDVNVLIDGNLTRSGNSVYATTWGDDLYAFVITPAQAKAAGLIAEGLISSGSPRSAVKQRMAKPIVTLSDVKIEGGLSVHGNAPVSGTVAYRFERPAKDAAVMFRVTRRLEKSVLTFINVNDLSDKGTIPFSIGPINSGESEVAFGPMPVFIELVMAGEGGAAAVASNTIALLLDVRPDLDAFARLSIGVFDKFTDILATVQDRASGAKAIEAYKQLATRNTALVEAMERLAPTKEQDAEIERKYGAKMDAAARRMQEQVTRIEQAEYGAAFFEDAKRAAGKK